MKVWNVSTTAYCCQDTDVKNTVTFSSYDEARKCFDFYKANYIMTNEYFKNNIKKNEPNAIEYSDGGDWFYGLYLEERDVVEEFKEENINELI